MNGKTSIVAKYDGYTSCPVSHLRPLPQLGLT
jgi:hypothetical protein